MLPVVTELTKKGKQNLCSLTPDRLFQCLIDTVIIYENQHIAGLKEMRVAIMSSSLHQTHPNVM